MTTKQKRDRYEMHKYWGKKPSGDLGILIDKYSKKGDILLDPFSGYGVFCCEAFLMGRNVISNDLNPIANFLNKQLFEYEVDLDLLQSQWKQIKKEFTTFVNKWYGFPVDSSNSHLTSILRDSNDVPLKAKVKVSGVNGSSEITFTAQETTDFLEFEKSWEISDWYPKNKLILNSRISAKKGMSVSDLFTKRTLACHARLLSLIEKYSSGSEKDLFKVAFTANLANCSKLVPPIKSRGEMSQGAWMTGFYIGPTYIENNVLVYFENRFKKILKGKADYIELLNSNRDNIKSPKNAYTYKITQDDAKHLNLENDSIDYLFTDPPYGGAVPYFEQSIIWNSWLKFTPDYTNEIVITDSKERDKDTKVFETEINLAFAEIRRVLKDNKYLSFTYHSLSGFEWKAITNACIINGFELHDYSWLVQKSFTPRQINRSTSVKGDVLVTLKKVPKNDKLKVASDIEITKMFTESITKWLSRETLDTNDIFLRVMKKIFTEKILIGDVNVLLILKENFNFSESNMWSNR